MKLTYVFPVIGLKTDIKTFFNELSKTKFFKKYEEDYELFFVADSANKDVIASAKSTTDEKVIALKAVPVLFVVLVVIILLLYFGGVLL